MTNQAYGQFCGLARALEVLGEPWALMVVRDLMVGPKTQDELSQGLPRMADGVLSARLEELEHAHVIRRRSPFEPRAQASYELTEYGGELEDVVLALGRWGAKTLGSPRRDEIVTADSMVIALRALFRPEAARDLRLTYMLKLGDITLFAKVDYGRLEVGKGHVPDPDLIIAAGPGIKALLAGEMSPREAIEIGVVRLESADDGIAPDPGLLAWFLEIFHIAPAPPACLMGNGYSLSSEVNSYAPSAMAV